MFDLLFPWKEKVWVIGCSVMLLLAGVLTAILIYVSGQLHTEQALHEVTRLERDNAIAEGMRWKAVVDATKPKIESLQSTITECLRREGASHKDALDRDSIMSLAQPRKQTTEDKKGIVDENTRKKAMARLNRPL